MATNAIKALHAKRTAVSLLCVGLIAGVLALAYLYGIKHSFHARIGEPAPKTIAAVAITETAYGVDPGGIASTRVLDTLVEYGFYDDPFPDNLNDGPTLNEGLRKAASLESFDPNISFGDGTACINNEDFGTPLYYVWAFRLFGYRVASLYYLYFLIVVISVVCFLTGHGNRPLFLAALAACLAVHFLSFGYIVNGFNPDRIEGFTYGYDNTRMESIGTVHNMRFATVLGIIPSLHVALSILGRQRLSIRSAVCAAIQMTILVFILGLRLSASWQWACLTVFLCIQHAWPLIRKRLPSWNGRSGADAAVPPRAAWWPVCLVIAGYLAFAAYRETSITPIYRIVDEMVPQHQVWHSFLVGLHYHPKWRDTLPREFQDAPPGDPFAHLATLQYMQKHFGLGQEYFDSRFFYGHRVRTEERAAKHAFLEFARNNPRYILESMLLYKPWFFLHLYATGLMGSITAVGALPTVAVSTCVMVVFFLAGIVAENVKRDSLAILGATALGACGASAPIVLTTPLFYAMADSFWMISFFLLCAAALCVTGIAHNRLGKAG